MQSIFYSSNWNVTSSNRLFLESIFELVVLMVLEVDPLVSFEETGIPFYAPNPYKLQNIMNTKLYDAP